jgi:small subunit ribosomal protein S15
MARMHTKKHGKAKSRKPNLDLVKAKEAGMSKQEIEDLIVSYAKQGTRLSVIGQTLKDKHNVPNIRHALGKRLASIAKEKGVGTEFPQDLMDLIREAVRMRRHLSLNKNDVHNKLGLTRVESKVWRLSKYYKREGVLPSDWKYDPEKAALLVK